MGYYTVKQIYPWLYSISDPQNVFCYLMEGEDRALLYDTAYGTVCLDGVIKTVTDKPYDVVLGHGHIDHANGASQFKTVYLHEGDFALFEEHTSADYRRNIAEGLMNSGKAPEGFDAETYVNAAGGSITKLSPGQVFDLGGLHIEVVEMPGHTAGSVGLLAREHKVLLTSDASNPHIWMFLEESLPMTDYIAMLARVSQLDFDTFFIGHSEAPLPKTEFEKYIRVAKNATVDKSTPYNPFPHLKGWLYQEDGVGIVFNEEKL